MNGFSLPEQKERLEAFCKFKGYEIIDYYQDAGISAKTGNLRPEFERLKDDIRDKKINTIIALKLDRITRSIFDWEKLITFLVVMVIYSVLLSAISSFTFGIGSMLLMGVLNYGIARVTLAKIRSGGDFKIGDLFCGFSECLGDSLLLGLLSNIFVALWSMLFVIPGLVKSYSYAMAPFIQHDSDNKNWKDCIDRSREMMNGHKWQLFCLDLSFIGWYLLGSLCFGFGVLFVVPYHYMARSNFYEALKASK